MTGEPELTAGDGGEWVLYLQQSLNHHYQQPVTAESGEFDAALAGTVRHFQAQQGLAATGVADTATWQALTGARYRWPDEPVATAEVAVGDLVIRLALTLTGEVAADGGDAIADLTADLAIEPPAITCTGATFLPGSAELVDGTAVEYTGTCALQGAADATGYTLTVTTDPATPAGSVAEWLARHAEPLTGAGTVALPATAALVEVG
ncbi:MAG: peptidoglycan-binding domain-containing protein [Actinophytocola sp.]|uniref:peptidoglycan-binding domain-containing protein n=1 Tax=Actinophytocola sp. TaxID=1872138 RepID=UPI003C764EBF